MFVFRGFSGQIPSLQDPSLAEKDCAICAESFADTLESKFSGRLNVSHDHRLWFTEESLHHWRYAMPVVRLRECGHMFHGACAKSPRRKKHGAFRTEWPKIVVPPNHPF